MNPYAARTYSQQSAQSASPIGLIVLLFNSALAALHVAIRAIEERDIELRVKKVNHVLAVIGELKSALDFERGGKVAQQFQRLYLWAEGQLIEASLKQDANLLRQVAENFTSVRDAWQQVDTTQAAPTAAATPPPAAPAYPSNPDPEAPRSRWSA